MITQRWTRPTPRSSARGKIHEAPDASRSPGQSHSRGSAHLHIGPWISARRLVDDHLIGARLGIGAFRDGGDSGRAG